MDGTNSRALNTEVLEYQMFEEVQYFTSHNMPQSLEYQQSDIDAVMQKTARIRCVDVSSKMSLIGSVV